MDIFTPILNTFKNVDLLNITFFLGNMRTKLHAFGNQFYNEYTSTMIERGVYAFHWICASLFGRKLEPLSQRWVSYTKLTCSFDMQETYDFLEDSDYGDHVYSEEDFEIIRSIAKEDNTILSYMILFRDHEKYISRMVGKTLTPIQRKRSNEGFISIQYTHPDMEESIYIDLTSGYYLCGNELLSATFIKRYLQYQNLPYVFDKQYTLHIIDNKINEFSIGYGKYLRLGVDNYQIVEEETI
jgi:hypothetical protein